MKNNELSIKQINFLFTKECKRRGIIKKTLLKNFMIDFINENYQEKSVKSTKDNNSEEIKTFGEKKEEKELTLKERKQLFDEKLTQGLSEEAKKKLS